MFPSHVVPLLAAAMQLCCCQLQREAKCCQMKKCQLLKKLSILATEVMRKRFQAITKKDAEKGKVEAQCRLLTYIDASSAFVGQNKSIFATTRINA
jgi:hypothetical protein